MDICEFLTRFDDDRTCLDHLVTVRLGNPPICPACNAAGTIKRTKRPRSYICALCRRTFTPTAHTFMHDSQVPVRLWFYTILLLATSRDGFSARFLQRQLGITYIAAWRMGDAIRRHFSALNAADIAPFTAPGTSVYIDETLVTNLVSDDGKTPARQIILGIYDGDRVVALPVANRSRECLIPPIERLVGRNVTVITDGLSSYRCLARLGYDHHTVDHSAGIWKSQAGHSTNAIEGFWARFKRSLRRTHQRIKARNLEFYLGEFVFRFNRRDCPDAILTEALSRISSVRHTTEVQKSG